MGHPLLTPPPPSGDPEAVARGERVMRQLAAQGIAPEALDDELGEADTAAALAWLRGAGPCPSID